MVIGATQILLLFLPSFIAALLRLAGKKPGWLWKSAICAFALVALGFLLYQSLRLLAEAVPANIAWRMRDDLEIVLLGCWWLFFPVMEAFLTLLRIPARWRHLAPAIFLGVIAWLIIGVYFVPFDDDSAQSRIATLMKVAMPILSWPVYHLLFETIFGLLADHEIRRDPIPPDDD